MTVLEKRSVTRGLKVSWKDYFHPRLRPREQWSGRVRERERKRRREKGRVHSHKHKALCLYTRSHQRYRPYWSFLGCSPAVGGVSGSQMAGEGFLYNVRSGGIGAWAMHCGVLAFNLTAQFHWPAWETRMHMRLVRTDIPMDRRIQSSDPDHVFLGILEGMQRYRYLGSRPEQIFHLPFSLLGLF